MWWRGEWDKLDDGDEEVRDDRVGGEREDRDRGGGERE